MNKNMRRLLSTTLSLALAALPTTPAWAAARTLPAGAAPLAGAVPVAAALPGLPAGLPSLMPAAGLSLELPAGAALQDPGLSAASTAGEAAARAPQAAAAAALQAPAASPVVAARPSDDVRGALTGLRAAAASASPAAPRSSRPSLLGRLVRAVTDKVTGGLVFDAAKSASPAAVMGLRPLPAPVLPQGVDIDVRRAPTNPDATQVPLVTINAFDIPGVRGAGGVFDAGPRTLDADPKDEAAVETALRAVVDADAARYGVTSAELSTVHVRRVEGQGDQADTLYAYFRQQKKSTNPDGSSQLVTVNGSYLSFTVKVVKDKPVLMAAMARLFPTIAVKTDAILSDAQLKDKADSQIQPNSGITLELMERKIVFHEGAWKTVNLYSIEGLPIPLGIMVAVDVATGDVFAWDARMGAAEAPPAPGPTDAGPEAAVNGTALGRGEKDDHRPNDQMQLAELPLPHLNVTIAGKAGVTDAEGRFSGSTSGASADLSAVLSGKWAVVNDRARKPVKIAATLTPGSDARVVANPTQSDELTVDQINTYRAVTVIHDWWSSRLRGDKRIDRAIPANVNIDQECNAYYTPGRPSLNFFKSSRRCSDTGRPGVVAHEYGHFVDDMIGGIVNGGLSEGWGDIGSMFLLGTPIIGEGFLKNTDPSWIRHGDNKYQYSDNDEVHDQGQAWMGFGWKLRKALIASMGEAAGAAEAESLIIPTLFAKASDIPSQMAQVLLNAMDKNGVIRHEAEIRGAAKAHGIDLPKNPGVIVSLVNWATARLKRVTVNGTTVDRGDNGALPPAMPPTEALPEAALAPQTAPAAPSVPQARARVTFTAGALVRGQVKREIQLYLDYHRADGLKGRLTEYGGVFSSDFLLEVEGPEHLVRGLLERLERFASR